METPIELVTVAAFETAPEAWIYQNKLATNEILAFVNDEHVANADWLYSGAIGGVKVQIPSVEVEKYAEFINSESTTEPVDLPEMLEAVDHTYCTSTCSKCNSIEISTQRWPKKINILVWLVIGFVVPVYSPSVKCNDCGFYARVPIQIPRQFNLIHLLLLMTFVAIITAWVLGKHT